MTGVVTIYTDGACKGNPGPGGWGALLVWGNREKELCGGDPATTNNRMELTAVIRALESLKRDCAVAIYTDSQYVKNGIQSWITHGRRTAGEPPAGSRSRTPNSGGNSTRSPHNIRCNGTGSRATTAIRATIAPMRSPIAASKR